MHSSRRQFAWMAAAGAAGLRGQTGTLTARQAIEKIQKASGVPWRAETVDTFKAGNPDTAVRGIATSVMSTLDVLQRAAAAGKNLIISHEPTFYNHQDQTEEFSGDAVYQAKQELIKKHDLVVWRFHDHIHARKPDPMLVGLAQSLGWEKYQQEQTPRRCVLPGVSLGDIASQAQSRMKIRAVRVVGDRKAQMTNVALSPGYTSLQGAVRAFRDADVVVCGEVREWEVVEYVQDAVAAGRKKGVVILGHAVSEDPGMRLCADWVKTFITEVPVEWISAGEPFWS